jgi:hypothetical protein
MTRFAASCRACLAPALGLLLVTAASACSSSSSSSVSSAPTQVTSASSATPTSSASGGAPGAIAQITSNWTRFFNPSTPDSERVKLLQNGSDFASSISSFSASPLASAVSSKVDSVTLSSATQAKVKYDLTAQGTPVTSGATGTSVLQDGTWKVGDDVFCALLNQAKVSGLSIAVPAICKSAG